MTSARDAAQAATLAEGSPLGFHVASAERAPFPIAITEGPSHTLRYANAPLARLCALEGDALPGRSLASLTRAPARLVSVLDRAYAQRTVELVRDVVLVATDGRAPSVTLVVTPLGSSEPRGLAAYMVAAGGEPPPLQQRDHVLAAVTHDLQSPLNAVAMTTQQLLARPELGYIEGIPRALRLIHRTAKHMQRLVDELLDTTGLQRGAVRLQPSELDLTELVQHATAMLEPSAQAKSITLTAELREAPLRVRGDAAHLLRVLTNLLANAIKFTPPAGRVTISAERTQDMALVSVRDTGPGIASEHRPKLFEPYWKGSEAGAAGLGLGLYIASGIVEAHGGHLEIVSAPGEGSTFHVRLPVAPRVDR